MIIATVCERPVIIGEFKFNNSLMYAIKEVSGDSENEVVSYFYGVAMKLFNDCVNRKKIPLRCNRKVKVFYKNTNFYVKFEVWTNYFKSRYTDKIKLNMELSFPRDFTCIDGNNMHTSLFETSIGLSNEQVASVERPKEVKYRCLDAEKTAEAAKQETTALSQEMIMLLPEPLRLKYYR